MNMAKPIMMIFTQVQSDTDCIYTHIEEIAKYALPYHSEPGVE